MAAQNSPTEHPLALSNRAPRSDRPFDDKNNSPTSACGQSKVIILGNGGLIWLTRRHFGIVDLEDEKVPGGEHCVEIVRVDPEQDRGHSR